MASAAGLCADEAERFGRAALHQRIGIGERRHQRVGRRSASTDEPERERRHLPHFGIGVAASSVATSGATPSATRVAADRQRRAAPDARLVVFEQRQQVGLRRRRRRRRDRRAAAAVGGVTTAGGGAGGAGSSQHPIFLEPQNPPIFSSKVMTARRARPTGGGADGARSTRAPASTQAGDPTIERELAQCEQSCRWSPCSA